jgi:hypothetical protein
MFIDGPSFFLKYVDYDAYVGLDLPSGGYPYRATTLKEVHFFNTLEKAEEYCSHFPNKFTIHRLTSINYERIK